MELLMILEFVMVIHLLDCLHGTLLLYAYIYMYKCDLWNLKVCVYINQ